MSWSSWVGLIGPSLGRPPLWRRDGTSVAELVLELPSCRNAHDLNRLVELRAGVGGGHGVLGQRKW